MVNWRGVFLAVTTQIKGDQSLHLPATMAHVERLLRSGVHGIIMLGSLGENCALEPDEKRQLVKAAVRRAIDTRLKLAA
jgi:dihydrodipicolinate synthase/N-acetylneuraminate lyase